MDNNLMDYLLLALLSYIHRNKTTVTLTISVFRYYFEVSFFIVNDTNE